ncbi:MAG: type III secretion system outer membrane ring subunit SctC [Gammaproteobacteria bacterium]|nr:type III secretion system outer membrane ring subunit SctC [Gammaproteobacteria bacterium]
MKSRTMTPVNRTPVLRQRLLALLAGLLLSFSSHIVVAESIPDFDVMVSMKAREQPVDSFLAQLFGQAGIPVVVDPRVVGTVNGDWNDTARNLHQTAMHTFQLVTYYDGVVAYVYNMNDMSRVVLPVGAATAKKIIAQARDMRLSDKYNRLARVSGSGLVVSGTPRYIEQIKEISYSIRQNTKKYVPQVTQRLFPLKHAWAHDTQIEIGGQTVHVPGVVTILNELVSGDGLPTPMVVSGSGDARSLEPLQKTPTTAAVSANNPQSTSTPQVTAQRAAGPSADIRIVAVPNLNAVLISDLENRMDGYQQLIDSLDLEPYMLEIEATIIDLNSSRSAEFGVNWRLQNDDGNEALVGNGTVSDQLLRPDTTITPQGEGGILSLAIGNQAEKFLARIRALEQEGDAEIISKPHVVTLSNQEAVLDTNQSFFVRVSGVEDAALFQITAGTTLRVTPHVYRVDGDYRIKLKVDIKDGATTEATVDQIPVVRQSSIVTTAIVSEGDSLLVGGLVREDKRDSVSKVPLLGDLPGLGSMFRTRSKSGSKVERMFLITPRLAYRKGFRKRMDAPILQGKLSDIVSTSVARRSAASETLQAAADKRRDPPRTFPAESPDPQIRPLPAPDTLLAADSSLVTNGQARPRALESLLIIPPAPAEQDLLVDAEIQNPQTLVPVSTVEAPERPRFTVQRMEEEPAPSVPTNLHNASTSVQSRPSGSDGNHGTPSATGASAAVVVPVAPAGPVSAGELAEEEEWLEVVQ